MTLDYRTINVTYRDAVVLYDFLSGAQETERGIHTDVPALQLAFWHLLGALEREVIAAMPDRFGEYERVLAEGLADLRQAAQGE